jgi:hypothetical protein
VILLCATLTMFVVVAALVVVAGYTVTCNELHYETKRQLYGRTTLGTPIKNLNIACYSLFRDVDFHSRDEIHLFKAKTHRRDKRDRVDRPVGLVVSNRAHSYDWRKQRMGRNKTAQ